MSPRVHPDPSQVDQIGHECPDPAQHLANRMSLEIACANGLWTHPSFRRHKAADGSLEALSCSMRCGCTFMAFPFE